jgi:hypothetical protein
MTETTTRLAATDSPLAFLLDIARQLDTISADDEREDAKTAALDHAWGHYPDTLGKALDEDDWTGYPALTGASLEPSAVAFLDGGLWLHFDRDTQLLTLIVPCTCGRGYVDTVLENEADLLELLKLLAPAGGRFQHDTAKPDCTSARRQQAWAVPRR